MRTTSTEPRFPQNQQLLMEGYALQQRGLLKEALEIFKRILKQEPDHSDALKLALSILDQQGDYLEAEKLLIKALSKNPSDLEIHNNLGKVYFELSQNTEALKCFDKVIALNPLFSEAYFNKGNVLKALSRVDESVESFQKASQLDPEDPLTHFNLGNVLKDLGRLSEALASYQNAIEIAPSFVDALVNQGSLLSEMQLYEQALDSFNKAVRLNPQSLDVWLNVGIIFNKLKRYEDALSAFDRAILLDSIHPDVWSNKGNSLYVLKRFGDALSAYKKALSINPDEPYLLGSLLYTKMRILDWGDFDGLKAKVSAKIKAGDKTIFPIALLGVLDDLDLQLKASKLWVQHECPPRTVLPPIPRVKREKIRLGYYSADFYNHAMSYLMAEFYELHDKSQFELIAFSLGPQIEDESRKRLMKAFDQFIDVSDLPDENIAKLSRELGIDIAVDLNGFTKDCRTGIFSYRAAPIQVNYLGYPGTMGAPYMDYIVADPILIPESSKSFYSEKIVYLPHTYQVNDTKRSIASNNFSRAEQGLPENGFVFCCFNNNFKITPSVLDGWSRILKSVEGSVLWLLEDNLWAKQNLLKEALSRGIGQERLVFAGRLNLPEHLARHRLADLFLDTTPYNAHTTASDALWAGLPVITLLGESFASRVAASLLNAIGLPELIAHIQDEYESMAIELAKNPEKLSVLREKLQAHRHLKPLFDSQLFTQHMQQAYSLMYERYQSDLSPEHLYIKP